MPRVPRILIVDDFSDMAELLSLFLSRVGGYETRTANSGFEAIRIAEEFRPDVILLDLTMPNLNGFQTARCIRSKAWGRGISFIAMSGYSDDRYERRAYEAGFLEYLPKPMQLGRIVAAIEQLSYSDFGATPPNLSAIYSPPKAASRPAARQLHPVFLRLVSKN